MKKSIALVLFTVVILEYALFFSSAQAETQAQSPNINNSSLLHLPYIHLYDEQGVPRTEFAQGEKIRIVTYYPSPIYIVKVIDPDGEVAFSKIVIAHKCEHYGVFDSGPLSGLTDKNGEWHVEAGILCWFKVKSFFVVPFGPFRCRRHPRSMLHRFQPRIRENTQKQGLTDAAIRFYSHARANPLRLLRPWQITGKQSF